METSNECFDEREIMNERLKLDDSLVEVVQKLSDGNPGAISVCAQLYNGSEHIDPQNFMKGWGQLISLDSFGIYGEDIWMLYKYVCNQSLVHVVALLRGTQLGIISREKLTAAIRNRDEGLDLPKIYEEVCRRLPNFDVDGRLNIDRLQ
jgi:hypothetical protein